jgi:hypothetical protein
MTYAGIIGLHSLSPLTILTTKNLQSRKELFYEKGMVFFIAVIFSERADKR